jgi:CheY-like chemotaxis protein
MASHRIAVLVVEDETLIRMAIVDELEDAGFEVFEAANSSEAVKILERTPRIKAMFTDVDMPGGIDGLELAAMVRGRWPPIVIIVTSGLRAVNADLLPDPAIFLPKPYDTTVVIQSIKALVRAG